MKALLTNFLEPLGYLVYTMAIFIQSRYGKQEYRKILLCYYILATMLMAYASLLVGDADYNNIPEYDALYIISSIVFLGYFRRLLPGNEDRQFVAWGFAIATIVLLSAGVLSGMEVFHSLSASVLSIVMVISCLLYFRQRLRSLGDQPILGDQDFWLVSGYLIYFIGSFFVLLTYAYFSYKLDSTILGYLWAVHNVFLFTASLITLSGTLWLRSQRKLS